ncbi:glycosyl hydrolase [Oscillochloris sp. ZM17-4]|uniref:VPS10 domain-containing protein n=1 Tax=Oscillochloris sp. ZM17-4 TaxID=2866714 RepID=UPI00351D797D
MDARLLQSLRWRCVGPPRGGRVVAVAGDPRDTATFYFGACAGGVWKTDDAGSYWTNISDGFFTSAAVGALAVAESDPNVIYVGTGEACLRGNVIAGDGVYRSTDAGKTWANVGLGETRHIGRVRVHPSDPDTAYVAALGHAFGPNAERGVYRTRDGGATWDLVLHRGPDAGAIDLCIDPDNPRVLYASLYQVRRNFWSLTSGGPGSGLFKSTDGGDTWTELTERPGLPKGLKGRIGVSAAPQAGRVWALVEAEEGGLFRSDDGGETWKLVSDDRNLRHRPWYYMHVFADPADADTVHILNLKYWKSTDGGKSFSEITTPHGDNHDLWIDPQNPRRMVEGNDGGACVSLNGGASWSTIYNQMTAQFYHVNVDSQTPYRVYGTQQDNSSISTPSRATNLGCIPWTASYPAGTGESGHIAIKPDDPNIVLVGAVGSSPGGGGALQRYDHRSGQLRLVTVWPEIYGGWGAGDLKYRFQWTFPILFSPHDPNLLYTCGNVAFTSTDLGESWEPISPDLTRADPETLGPSGGPITKDCTGAEHYATIFAFAESPLTPGLLWAGSDDGLLHLSRDGGASWANITPPDMAARTLISWIEPSPFDAGTAYLAATRYKLAEEQPILLVTRDYGASWASITAGVPDGAYTRVVKADREMRGLLFAGTERGVYVSFDDGAAWQPLGGGLPVVPVHDLVIKDDDLVAATHGRSFWILDDITPLRQLAGAGDRLWMARPRDTVRLLGGLAPWRGGEAGKNYMLGLGTVGTFTQRTGPHGEELRTFLDAGENPPAGVIIHYNLAEAPAEDAELRLDILGGAGQLIRSFTRRPPGGGDGGPWLPADPGMNRFVWSMRHADARKLPGDPTTEAALLGPLVSPGAYEARLTLGDAQVSQRFQLLQDPRTSASQADLDAQEALLLQIRDKLSATHAAIQRLRAVRMQAEGLAERLGAGEEVAAIRAAARALIARLTEVEGQLVQTRAKTAFDTINIPSRLNHKLASLSNVVAGGDGAPTRQSREVFADLSARIDAQLAALDALLAGDVPALNQQVAAQEVPAIIPPA